MWSEAKLNPKKKKKERKSYEQRCVFNFPGLADAFRFVLAVKREAHTEFFFYKGYKCY